jgi:hypothetical protein
MSFARRLQRLLGGIAPDSIDVVPVVSTQFRQLRVRPQPGDCLMGNPLIGYLSLIHDDQEFPLADYGWPLSDSNEEKLDLFLLDSDNFRRYTEEFAMAFGLRPGEVALKGPTRTTELLAFGVISV